MATRVSPKKISLDNHILDFPLLRIFIFFFFFFCVLSVLVARAAVTHFPSARARTHARTRARAHTHAHTRTHARTHTYIRTHTHTHRHHHLSLFPPFFVFTCQQLCINNHVTHPFFILFCSFYQICGYMNIPQQSVDALCDIMVIFQASFGVCA